MDTIEQKLEARLGRIHTRQRLGIEAAHGHRVLGQGLNFFHPENWYSTHALIRFAIQLVGMYARGDYRAQTHGEIDSAVAGMQQLVTMLKQPI